MTTPPRLVRFGAFELDVRTGELRKKGIRIHLQEQPFQVLAMLIERAGDLVMRDELRRRLWPDAVFVDFDIGLNKAVAKLRTALGDSADSPRFVETLERRGYRFIADVVECEPASCPAPAGPVSHPDRGRRARVIRLASEDRTIALAEGVHVIGRDPGAAVWIHSSVVSRRHASITVSQAGVSIEDLDSRNGTFVNGTRLDAPRALADGDEVRIGPTQFVVLSIAALTATEMQSD